MYVLSQIPEAGQAVATTVERYGVVGVLSIAVVALGYLFKAAVGRLLKYLENDREAREAEMRQLIANNTTLAANQAGVLEILKDIKEALRRAQ